MTAVEPGNFRYYHVWYEYASKITTVVMLCCFSGANGASNY